MWKPAFVACAIVATLGSAVAQYYSDATLAAKNPKALENLQYTVSDQLLKAASPEVQAKLRDVRVVTPLRSPDPNYPMNFYADAAGKQIIVPLQGFKFFSDLTILWAWFDRRSNCDKRGLAAYLAAVMTGSREANELGAPFDAFGLTESDALRDPVVDRVSLRNFNTGMNFVLAHELGHIYYGDGLPGQTGTSIEREKRADRFALDLMAVAHIAPVGLIEFFSATRFNDQELLAAAGGTHPLSHLRLIAIGDRLKQSPESFLPTPFPPDKDFATERTRMIRVADGVTAIAAELQDETFARNLIKLVQEYPPSVLRTACR